MGIREINRKIKSIRRGIETKIYSYFNDIDNSNIKIDKEKIKKILIINGSAIGNLIAYTPLIEAFKRYDENLQVDFVTEGSSQDILKSDKRVGNIYSQNDFVKIKDEKYDLAIYEGEIGIKEHKFLKSIKAKYYIGSTFKFKIFNQVIKCNEEDHIFEMMNQITQSVFGIEAENKYKIFYDESSKYEIKKLINTNKKIVVINKFTSSIWKNISNEDYISIINKLILNNYFVIGLYPPNERKTMDYFEKEIANCNFFCLKKVSGIMDSVYLISIADFIITADTSIIHLACGLEKPVIGIYITASFYKKWAPNIKNSIQLIYNRGKREGKKTSIKGIDSDMILEKIKLMEKNLIVEPMVEIIKILED